MAFTASGVFKQFILDPVYAGTSTSATGYGANGIGASGDTVKVSLFDNTVTPDKDAAVGSTGYATGTWASGGVSHANWPAAGQTLAGNTLSSVTNAVMFDATDLAGAGTLTLTGFYGCFVYDDTITAGTVADQGVCFNYFGGTNTVTGGTLTIIWHANGLFRVTV